MNRKEVLEILNSNSMSPLKKFGQNFLVDNNIIDKIISAANINSSKDVIEIGPGLGSLTRKIVETSANTTCIEIDKGFAKLLQDSNYNNLKVICEDVMKISFEDFNLNNPIIISNLPYYITTPIISKIIDSGMKYESMVLMMQKEVAERFMAKEATTNYSSISFYIQNSNDISKVTDVSSTCFYPKPDVDSIVIKLTKKSPLYTPFDKDKFELYIRALFKQKRKTVLNNFKDEKDIFQNILVNQGLSNKVRSQELTRQQIVDIYEEYCAKN